MSTETELKLAIAPEHVEKFLQYPLLQTFTATTKHLCNTYFDTSELDLLKKKIGLRIRYVDNMRLQTIKTAGQSIGGLHQRQEWEMAIDGDVPRYELMPEQIRARMPASSLLLPVFTTNFQRKQWNIEIGDSMVELVLDQGTIQSSQTVMPLYEIELEIKKGSTTALYNIALDLLNYLSLRIENQSKAARGYQLFHPKAPKIVHAAIIHLDRTMTAKQAFIHTVWQELQHLQANEFSILSGDNVEAIHQMRVAVRRLRSYFGIFKPFVPVPCEEYSMLRKELHWLGEESGMARDWDVFYQTLYEVRQQVATTAVLDSLVVTVRYFKTQAHEKMREILNSTRYHRLLLSLGKWLTQQNEVTETSGARWELPVTELAGEILQRRYLFVQEQGEKLLKLSETQRHAVRIEIKKLSYAARLFASLYPSENTQDYLNTVSKLQTELGILNDMAVAHSLLDRAGLHPHSPAQHLLIGWYAYQRVIHLKKLEKTWTTWLKQKTFW
jgi:inorganic triphosphatase YgiF